MTRMTSGGRRLRIDIVGGGIGGVTLAAALHHFDLPFRLFERAPALRAVGYGLTLQKNALDALDLIGLGQAIRRRGVAIKTGLLRQPSGRVLTSAAAELCAVHRATLIAELSVRVPPESFLLGQQIDEVTDADIVIAADGFHSKLRSRVAPGERAPRDCGYTAWRGLAARTPTIDRSINGAAASETWGRGTRFGIVPIDGNQIYWFAVAPIEPFGDASTTRRFLLDTFRGWHEPIGALLDATAPGLVLESKIVDRLPIPTWSAGKVVLLGDAAHPMTPNLGQGGCQAVEDAVVLAHLIRACGEGRIELSAVAPRYEQQRRARAYGIVEQSFAVGRLARQSNPIVVAIRDSLFRMIPPRVQARQLARIVTFPGAPD